MQVRLLPLAFDPSVTVNISGEYYFGGIMMNLDTNLIINTVKREYLSYMQSLEISENTQNRLYWSKTNHITIYIIPLVAEPLYFPDDTHYDSLAFAKRSNEDRLEILELPQNTKVPYVKQRELENIFDYLANHKLINIKANEKGDIFDITASRFLLDITDSNDLIEAFENWSYHFLDMQLEFMDFNDSLSLEDNEKESELIDKVNDEIFSYQYKEATTLLSLESYLGAACVFGVALERICILIAKNNQLKIRKDKTELGFFAYKLFNDNIISDAFKKRLLGASKFRNLSAHSNEQAVKGDALTLDAVINDLVDEYL